MMTIFTYPLAQVLLKNKTDFTDVRSFNLYKKNEIYQLRNKHLSQILNKEILNEDFSVTEWGKPYLTHHEELAFNHTHSQNNYALAISQNYADIGIDVEDLTRQVRYEALAKHAFHPNELYVWQLSDYSKEYWFKVWTTKEAVLKAFGLGIRISLNELDTQVSLEQNMGQCHHAAIGTLQYQNFLFNNMMLTVAWIKCESESEEKWPNIEIISH